jgi:hypothetical protein
MSAAYRYVNGILDISAGFIYYRCMADEKDPRIITPIPKPLLGRIDDYRFENRLPSRAEAIRQLIEAGLGTAPPRAPSRGSPPGSSPRKPAGPAKTVAPRAKKPTVSDRQATAAQTKEAQIRALREEGAQ